MNYLGESLAELKRLAIMGGNLAFIVLGLWLLVTVFSNSSPCHEDARGVERAGLVISGRNALYPAHAQHLSNYRPMQRRRS